MSEERFEIKVGRFGSYFYDKDLKTDVDLKQAVKMLNEWAVLERIGKSLEGDER